MIGSQYKSLVGEYDVLTDFTPPCSFDSGVVEPKDRVDSEGESRQGQQQYVVDDRPISSSNV